jgi:hypothetical protein
MSPNTRLGSPFKVSTIRNISTHVNPPLAALVIRDGLSKQFGQLKGNITESDFSVHTPVTAWRFP